ncbi:hypothetical protein PR202_gb02596 [Eleusine coracana subsp. coracana]|uniref:RING-type domain-containing protein n=1 Tax=Eleusine coracana subsp. coracana TaxID=191504 RepID=A0AAV5DZN2_ELECO|nr:hypothetical protein PR202_gb02596 [Eleusine coracana subsp. coracana]
MEMEGRVLRRSVTLADQLAAVGPPPVPASPGSCNLRDLLKLRDEDELAAAGRRAAAVTLASAMAAERQTSLPAPSSTSSSSSSSVSAAAAAARTLLDIIRDDQPPSSAAAAAGDPLVRRAVSLPAPIATPSPTPTSAAPPAPTPVAPHPPLAAAEEEGERVSLMALLEQTDRQWSAGVSSAASAREEDDSPPPADTEAEALLLAVDDDEEEVEDAAAGKGVVPGSCCVCMARGKGAAFIPCGHTFCRLCARELLAGRGRCPLCNAAIVDVLDIF